MVGNTSSTVWKAVPHTLAKHDILKGYLNAWMPILTRIKTRKPYILYVDGFAGPGEYTDGEPGSPIIAFQTAAEHSHDFPIPIRMVFIEAREDRVKHLYSIVALAQKNIGKIDSIKIEEPIHGLAESELKRLVDSEIQAHGALGPALFFLDQFGYSAVSMDLMKELLRHNMCEVFSFLNWRDLNRYLTDESKWAGITRSFGGDEWKVVLDLEHGRAEKLRELYTTALRDRAGAQFFCSFAMYSNTNQLLCWLFFATGNVRGLEEMKKSMWRVDSTGGFKFADRHANQLSLLSAFDDKWLAGTMTSQLKGKTMTIKSVRNWVLVETPCHKYTGAMRILERGSGLTIRGTPKGRRKGTFNKYLDNRNVRVKFQ